MNLTALEIKQRTFEKSLRGYDISEVNAFLSSIATEWEHIVGRIKDQEREISQLRDKLKHYERVEEALHETLQTAKENAEQRIETARKEARSKVETAEMEAEKILQDVRVQRQEIRQSILRLLERREEIIRGIGSYIDTAQKSLQSFSRDDSDIYALTHDDEKIRSEKKARRSEQKKNDQAKETEKVAAPGSEDLDDILDELD
ncbi:MAG: DivIVA domain-containing protein [Balneolaceae bacterium]|jgi:cell division initiation protein|nr:MAG: DivIVA domain-containing protein [Balneolaceae bacterium]